MAFSLDMPGGWCDIPASAWAAGNVGVEDLLVALNSMVRFAATCDEYIAAAPQRSGNSVALPASPDDGYNYSRSEALYAFAVQASPNPDTGKNSAGGNVLFFHDFIAQDTGLVTSVVNYYVQGGQESSSNDGLLCVLLILRRGAGNRTGVAGGTGGGVAGGGGGVVTGGSNLGGNGGDGGGDVGTGGDGGGDGGPKMLV